MQVRSKMKWRHWWRRWHHCLTKSSNVVDVEEVVLAKVALVIVNLVLLAARKKNKTSTDWVLSRRASPPPNWRGSLWPAHWQDPRLMEVESTNWLLTPITWPKQYIQTVRMFQHPRWLIGLFVWCSQPLLRLSVLNFVCESKPIITLASNQTFSAIFPWHDNKGDYDDDPTKMKVTMIKALFTTIRKTMMTRISNSLHICTEESEVEDGGITTHELL